MLRILLPVLALGFAIDPVLPAGILPKADRVPGAPTAEQVALVRDGVALHDRREYQAAIAKYKQVLAQNPWEVNALHELALSYFESKDYQRALDTARLGAHCRSQGLAGFYAIIGNALDELGRGPEAIQTYRAAIKLNPRMGLLHYNLAVSLRRAGKPAEAKEAVQRAIRCDPIRPSGHATLGAIYQDMGYRVPAILAYSRFLALEPDSERSAQVMAKLEGLLTAGVGQGDKPGEITVRISEPPKGRNGEGDFTGAEMMMSIVLASSLIAKPGEAQKPPESAYQKLVSLYTSLGESLENSKPKGGFAATFYAPYFAALTKAGHTEAFVAHAWKTGKVEGASAWAEANQAKLVEFLAWSKDYRWPVD
jgi:tetratricopeptide (TPR) repeat protein